MSELSVTGLKKAFGDIVALDGVDLSVDKGEFFALLGPSASGKTTTLRTICGIERADQGTVMYQGQDVTHAEVRGRGIAMVFQTFALYPHLSIFENLAYPLRQAGVTRDEINRRVGETAEMLRLTHTLKRKPGTASGGEQQRIAIGRALVRDPGAFLMDEPIAALDARLREEMRVELKRLQREQNHTLVYVTHDQEEAMSVADRMAIFEDGRIRQIGTPTEIYNKPNSRYVAELIGSPPMNFIDGTFADGKFTAEKENVIVAIDGVSASGAATLAIRPEDIEIRDSDQPGIDAKVYEVEPLGAFTIVDIIIGEKIVKVQVTGQPDFELGSGVRLNFDPLNCHLFDGVSGDIIAHAKH